MASPVRAKLFAVFLLLVAGCALSPRGDDINLAQVSTQQVVARLALYEDSMRRMDYDQSADMFTESGEVSSVGAAAVQGREAIRKFLKSFAAFRILAYSTLADSTAVDGISATQLGVYSQTVIVPAGDTIHVHGRFEALWSHQPNGDWQLQRMHTIPIK